MQVRSVRSRLKRCNIRFCLAGHTRAISRAQPELSQPVSNEECKVHWAVLKGLRERCANGVDSIRQAFIQRRPSRCDRHSSLPNDPRRRRQACAAGAWHRLDGVAIVFIRNNPAQQSSTGRYWHLWVSWPCRPVRCLQRFQLLCLPRWSHRYQGQLLPAAGLELVRLPVRDNPLAIFRNPDCLPRQEEVSCACPALMNFKAKMDVRLWGRN